MQTNRMKEKFAAGEPAFGLSVMIPSPQIVESAAGMGFDWVLIDCEHGTVGLESMELMVMAAEAAGVTPIVRPRTNAPEDILQAMDRGARASRCRTSIPPRRRARRSKPSSSIRRDSAASLPERAPRATVFAARSATSSPKRIGRRWFACRSRTRKHCRTSTTSCGRGRRRVLHRPVRSVAVDGPPGQPEGARRRAGDRRRRLRKSSPRGRRRGCPPRPPPSRARSRAACATSTRTCRRSSRAAPARISAAPAEAGAIAAMNGSSSHLDLLMLAEFHSMALLKIARMGNPILKKIARAGRRPDRPADRKARGGHDGDARRHRRQRPRRTAGARQQARRRLSHRAAPDSRRRPISSRCHGRY